MEESKKILEAFQTIEVPFGSEIIVPDHKMSHVVLDGKVIPYSDAIVHSKIIVLNFWLRIKILFGAKINSTTIIYTKNRECRVSGSRTEVKVIFNNKNHTNDTVRS